MIKTTMKAMASLNSSFDWTLAVRFARFHSLELPLDLLNKCAASDNWLVFTICCQLHEYPKELVLNSLKFFNNECISDHLSKAFQSSHKILADSERDNTTKILNRNETPNRPITTSRNALYARIGVRAQQTPSPDTNGRTPLQRSVRLSTSFQMESDDQSIASETDYNGIETISVVSSSNTSDPEEITKIDPENCPNDLLQVILHFQTDSSCDPRKALMYSSVLLSNPILCLIACSVDYSTQNGQNVSINNFAAFSCWLLASVDFSVRKQFCESVEGFDALNWTLESSYHVIDLVTSDVNNYLILLRGLKIFSLNIPPLVNLLKFFNIFLCEKNYYHVENLKAFNEWTLRAEQNLDSFEFWDKCWHSLQSIDPSMRSTFTLFHKFLTRIPSLIVKCFLIFKCLIASKQSDNHKESETLESMLWDCVISIESAGQESSVWSEIWSDIMAYFKSNKQSINRLPTKLNSSVNSDQMSKTIDKVIEKLLNNRCIEKAQEVSRLFKYNHQDLDIILVMYHAASSSPLIVFIADL